MDATTVPTPDIPQYEPIDVSSLGISSQPAVNETQDISPVQINTPTVEDRLAIIESILNITN